MKVYKQAKNLTLTNLNAAIEKVRFQGA